jgi:hypothetical protein
LRHIDAISVPVSFNKRTDEWYWLIDHAKDTVIKTPASPDVVEFKDHDQRNQVRLLVYLENNEVLLTKMFGKPAEVNGDSMSQGRVHRTSRVNLEWRCVRRIWAQFSFFTKETAMRSAILFAFVLACSALSATESHAQGYGSYGYGQYQQPPYQPFQGTAYRVGSTTFYNGFGQYGEYHGTSMQVGRSFTVYQGYTGERSHSRFTNPYAYSNYRRVYPQ